MAQDTIQSFVQAELARLNQQRQAAMAAKGQLTFMALPVGETRVELQAAIPADYDGGQGNIKKLFTVIPEKAPFLDSNNTQIDKEWSPSKKYSWPVNPRSPTYREALDLLLKAPVKIAIVRTGKDKTTTRYDIRVAA